MTHFRSFDCTRELPRNYSLIVVSIGIKYTRLNEHRVEYFGQKLDGFEFTTGGWVQSYGSRYVRPPLIYDDVSRPAAMTVKEFQYAQSLTRKPVKGMLTGALFIPPLPTHTHPSCTLCTCLTSIAIRLPSNCLSLAISGWEPMSTANHLDTSISDLLTELDVQDTGTEVRPRRRVRAHVDS